MRAECVHFIVTTGQQAATILNEPTVLSFVLFETFFPSFPGNRCDVQLLLAFLLVGFVDLIAVEEKQFVMYLICYINKFFNVMVGFYF